MSQPPESPPAAAPTPPRAHAFAWLPYARLVRIPNVFTAVADIALARPPPPRAPPLRRPASPPPRPHPERLHRRRRHRPRRPRRRHPHRQLPGFFAAGAGVRVPLLQRHGLERLLRRGTGHARTALPA